MHKKYYRFAHACIELCLPEELSIPENMRMFEVDELQENIVGDLVQKPDKTIELEIVDDLSPLVTQFREQYPDAGQILRKNMCIIAAQEKECRIISIEGKTAPYAVLVEESPEYTRTWVHKDAVGYAHIDTIFGSLLGLEKVMIRKDALILHSAYMCRDGQAVLFSAPSETGKSTQAGLWEKYRGTRQVNGDRALLVRGEDGWYAYGWPICGSSEICHNETHPIQAIVMLYQAKENVVKRLGVGAAMKKVMSQVMINMWNGEFQIKAMDLIQQLVMEVPVYELGCNISEDAVVCLEKALDGVD